MRDLEWNRGVVQNDPHHIVFRLPEGPSFINCGDVALIVSDGDVAHRIGDGAKQLDHVFLDRAVRPAFVGGKAPAGREGGIRTNEVIQGALAGVAEGGFSRGQGGLNATGPC